MKPNSHMKLGDKNMYNRTHHLQTGRLAKQGQGAGLSATLAKRLARIYASSPEGCSGVAGLALLLRFALLWPRLRCAALMRTW